MITIIAAMDKNRVIGDSNTKGMLWHSPLELQHFRASTIGKKCIVGNNTYSQMPLLDNRDVYVMSHGNFVPPCANYYHYHDISNCSDDEELMVIGGASVYRHFMPIADKLIISVMDISVNGDILMPSFGSGWVVSSISESTEADFTVTTYNRAFK